jgi:tetratricopeptide (TPR) repeat protein
VSSRGSGASPDDGVRAQIDEAVRLLEAGDAALALARFEVLAEEAMDAYDAEAAAACHLNSGLCWERLDRDDLAFAAFTEAHRRSERIGDWSGASAAQRRLAGVLRRRGQRAEANRVLASALELARRARDPLERGLCYADLAEAARDPEKALTFADAAVADLDGAGEPAALAHAHDVRARLLVDAEEWVDAHEDADRAWRLRRDLGDPAAAERARDFAAELARLADRPEPD